MRQTRADTERSIALFWLAPAGIRRFIVSCFFVALSELLARMIALLASKGSVASLLKTGRIVSVPLPWLSPSIRGYGCVLGGWGDFPQQLFATVSRSLPLIIILSGELN
jgi:hypothetical protein